MKIYQDVSAEHLENEGHLTGIESIPQNHLYILSDMLLPFVMALLPSQTRDIIRDHLGILAELPKSPKADLSRYYMSHRLLKSMCRQSRWYGQKQKRNHGYPGRV